MAQTPAEIRKLCTRFLSGHKPWSVKDRLASMAASPWAEYDPDIYGEGELINSLEHEVAELLGKESGLFVMKGIIAQLSALRAWTNRSGVHTVALHPWSHIDLDESHAYERLHPLQGLRTGDYEPFRAADLDALAERVGVVVVELPLRRSGFRLPPWDDLVAISEWCRERNVPLHFDGARLWECTAFYGRSYAEICSLADSVYVSFYKGVGGLAGCVLAGAADFIKEANAWKGRHGGNIFTAFPYVLTAKQGLQEHVPKMASYCARARDIAAALSAIPGLHIAPDPPHTNAFQVYFPARPKPLEQAHLEIAESERVWLFGGFWPTPLPNISMSEVQLGSG
ncbi:MAG: threonine aldolase family protein, partial [Chloroflexia bacterium]